MAVASLNIYKYYLSLCLGMLYYCTRGCCGAKDCISDGRKKGAKLVCSASSCLFAQEVSIRNWTGLLSLAV